MEPASRENAAQPHIRTREKPGWTAIALVAAFVLAAVVMFALGARLVKRSPGPDLSAIAIVPFTDVGADAGRESLGALFARQLADVVSKTGGVHVTRRPEAGSLIEGSVQKSGDRLRVAAWLVRAADRRALWTHTFEFTEKDAAAVREEIARGVVDALRLGPGATARK